MKCRYYEHLEGRGIVCSHYCSLVDWKAETIAGLKDKGKEKGCLRERLCKE